MKIKLFSSTLSCVLKSIGFAAGMINKKIIFGLLVLNFVGACSSPTAMLGPAFTLSSSGNVYQAGLNYSTNQIVTMYTGKTPIENLKGISLAKQKNNKNIKKKTLESDDFYLLVKDRIDKTRGIIKLSNQ